MEIGIRIRELRLANNMTQKDLADILFVTPQAVSRWESNTAEPSLDIIDKLASHFDVSVDYMMGKAPQENKSVTPIIEKKVETRPVLAVCESCNTPLYSGNDIVRKSHTSGSRGQHRTHTRVICATCNEKQIKAQIEYAEMEGKKNRLRSFILGGLIAAAVLTLALLVTIPTGDAAIISGGVLVSILSFTLSGCLFLRNNFVGDMVGGIIDWGFIRFPGLIFTLDLDGIIWLLTVKLLFWAIGFIVAFAFLFLAVALGLAVSAFVYPFALRKSILRPDDFEQ